MIGRHVGIVPTLALVLATAAAGSHFCHREGRRALDGIKASLREGRFVPSELVDAVLVLAGGILLLTPGLLTDLFGIALLLPASRPHARRLLARILPIRFAPISLDLFAMRPGREEIRDVDAKVREEDRPDSKPTPGMENRP